MPKRRLSRSACPVCVLGMLSTPATRARVVHSTDAWCDGLHATFGVELFHGEGRTEAYLAQGEQDGPLDPRCEAVSVARGDERCG